MDADLSRPDPQDIAQIGNIHDPTAARAARRIPATLGKPESEKPKTADNFDVLIEHYLNPFGMISAGYFYKRLTDPIVTQSLVLSKIFQPSPIAPFPARIRLPSQSMRETRGSLDLKLRTLQHLTFPSGQAGRSGVLRRIMAIYGVAS